MDYDEIIGGYSFELQLIDALDEISRYSFDAAEILDQWASRSSNEKSAAEFRLLDPNQQSSFPDTQSP